MRGGYGKRRALYSCDALASLGEAEVLRGCNCHAGGAVNLLQQIVVDENAAILRGDEVGAPTGGTKKARSAS